MENGNIPKKIHMKHIICRALTGTLKIIFKITTIIFFFKHTIRRLKLLAIVMLNRGYAIKTDNMLTVICMYIIHICTRHGLISIVDLLIELTQII